MKKGETKRGGKGLRGTPCQKGKKIISEGAYRGKKTSRREI